MEGYLPLERKQYQAVLEYTKRRLDELFEIEVEDQTDGQLALLVALDGLLLAVHSCIKENSSDG